MRARDHLLAAAVLGYALFMIVLTAAGVPLPRADDGVLGVWDDFRFDFRNSMKPARTYGIAQRWMMFRKVSKRTGRIEIAVRQDGQWRDVFVERTDLDWRRDTFEHHRWREFSNHLRGTKKRDQWRLYVPWAAERAFQDFPHADAVRFRVTGARIPKPELLAKRGALDFKVLKKEDIVER